MLEGITKLTIRIMLATAIIILINTFGQYYQFIIPVNVINIALIAGFGVLGVLAVVIFRFFI